MKKTVSYILCFIMLGLMFHSCTNEDKKDISVSEYSEVEFELGLLGNPNLTKTDDLGSCRTDDELQNLAKNENLFLNITIAKNGDNSIINKVINIVFTGEKYISEPILLGKGSYSVTMATITTQTDNDTELLFSAVGESSAYKKYVPKNLPIKFIIGEGEGDNVLPLFQKSTLDIFVICVIDEDANDFGFGKWNVHFTKLYYVPFTINYCDETGEDFRAAGNIRIQNGTYENNVFTPAKDIVQKDKWGEIDDIIYFNSEGALSKLSFADNYEINNDIEYYKITLNITFPVDKTIISYVNTEELISYRNTRINDTWNEEYNMMHFNFCKCITWFFENDCDEPEEPVIDPTDECENGVDINFDTDTTDDIDKTLTIKYKGSFVGISKFMEDNKVDIAAGDKVRIMKPISLEKDILMFCKIYGDFTNNQGVNPTNPGNIYQISIYSDPSFKKKVDKMNVKSDKYINVTEVQKCFETDVDEQGCYYMEIHFTSKVSGMSRIHIDRAPDNKCPE